MNGQGMLAILTQEERERAAQWLTDNMPITFRFSTDSSGYQQAVRTLRDGAA